MHLDLTDKITQFCNLNRNNIKQIRMDNDEEYTLDQLKSWMAKKGIESELSPPYSPESNGDVERLNCTLDYAVRTMLSDLSKTKAPFH